MKKYFLPLLLFFIIKQSANSQGLIFDSAKFASRISLTVTRGYLPPAYSLKQYTPIIYPQVASTCVAHSFATARTILAAKSLGWTDKQKISSIYFSPYYIYYRNKSEYDIGCTSGLDVESTAKDVLQNGFAPIVDVEYPYYYPFTQAALCIDRKGTSYPPTMDEDAQDASKYKIDEIYSISTVQQLKTALSGGMPVVVILFPPPSFTNAKSDLWTPLLIEKVDKTIMAHAVIAIGYDDNKYGGSVEIMNSWGDTWGNKGFISIRYRDYAKWFVGGYAFYLKDNKSNSAPDRIAENLSNTHGETVSPKNISVRRGYGNYVTKFNNGELLKAFNKK